MRERQVHLCGAEIVPFVGNRWKRKIPRTRSRARAVSSFGGASGLSSEPSGEIVKVSDKMLRDRPQTSSRCFYLIRVFQLMELEHTLKSLKIHPIRTYEEDTNGEPF